MENYAVVNTVNKTGWGTPSIQFYTTKEDAEKRTGYFGKVAQVMCKSKSKTMTLEEAEKNGYSFAKSHFSLSDSFYDKDTNTVYLIAKKLVLKEGVTEEDVQKRMQYMWDNNISGDLMEYYNIID